MRLSQPERHVRHEDQQRSEEGPGDQGERPTDDGERTDLQPPVPHQTPAPPESAERRASFELDHGDDQRPADGQPDRDRDEHDAWSGTPRPRAPRPRARPAAGQIGVERETVGTQGRDRPTSVDLDQRPRGRRHHETEPEQRQRGADREHAEDEDPAALAFGLDAEDARAAEERPTGARSRSRRSATRGGRCRRTAAAGRRTCVRRQRASGPRRAGARAGAASGPPCRARESEHDQQPTRATSARNHGSGLSRLRRRALEPAATAPQKKSVAPVPSAPPPGTAILRSRQSSDQLIGAVHCDLRFGPVGPLKNARCSSPQRP